MITLDTKSARASEKEGWRVRARWSILSKLDLPVVLGAAEMNSRSERSTARPQRNMVWTNNNSHRTSNLICPATYRPLWIASFLAIGRARHTRWTPFPWSKMQTTNLWRPAWMNASTLTGRSSYESGDADRIMETYLLRWLVQLAGNFLNAVRIFRWIKRLELETLTNRTIDSTIQ